jgi:integrase/recombinase XerD
MPAKLATTIKNIEKKVHNNTNRGLIAEFYNYLTSIDTSESYQNGLLKVIIRFAEYLGPNVTFYQIQNKEQILKFLDLKKKIEPEDPDKKWITTWNDYLWRIKYFYRWLDNSKEKGVKGRSLDSWITPSFINIKMKRTKRLSPYLETEIWDRDELFTIIKHEQYKRNKAVLALLWDLDARAHEVALLQIKHIRLKEKYGEGEIPHEAKTGSGPVLLTFSFPYIRDWLNEHPFKNQPQARLICNLLTGAPIRADQINEIMKQLKKRIERLLENDKIIDNQEKKRLEYLLKTKKWNPYCIRHSAITADSDYLPEYALKKKVRWSMNSKQGSRYIKKRMGNELKNKILEYNGISIDPLKIQKQTVSNCPKCDLVNALENRYCSKCSYPLSPEAYDQIKQDEEKRFIEMEKKYTNKLTNIEDTLEKLILKIDMQKMM